MSHTPESLTAEDIDQIAEGIEHFIIGVVDPDEEVAALWQPYIDKLKAHRASLAAAPDMLAACKALHAEVQSHNDDYHHVTSKERISSVDAVIAKAEGR